MTTISENLYAAAAAAVIALAGLIGPAAAETLTVTVAKSELLRLDRAAAAVMVAEPTVADVQVESPRLVLVIGKAVGETNLIVLDGNGAEIIRYDVLVVPEAGRHVTIYHGGDGVRTLSCNPRCAGVKNPGTDPEPKAAGGGAGGPMLNAPAATGASSGAFAAPAPTAAAAQQPAANSGPALAPGATVDQGSSGSSAAKRGY